MKITARVTFPSSEERASLVQAFFGKSDFSPKNILRIYDDETAFIHLEFEDTPPQMIVQAISQCTIIFMDNLETSNFWDLMTEADTDHNLVPAAEPQKEESSDEVPEVPKEDEGLSEKVPEEAAPEEEEKPSNDEHPEMTEEQTEETQTEAVETPSEAADEKKMVSAVIQRVPKPIKKRRFGRQKPTEEDYLDIPEFETFAKQAATLSMYTDVIAGWLGLDDEDTKYFKDIVTELTKLDKVPYEIANKEVKNANITLGHNDYRKVKFSKTITGLLESKGIDATLLPFLITVIKFANQIQYETQATENQTEEPKYLECDAFVKILKSVDQNVSPEEKAREITRAMGLEQYSKPLYKSTCNIIQAAFSMEKFESIDDVLQVAGIEAGTKDGIKVKADLAKWINDFNKKNHVDRMKIVAFLRELKAILT